MFGRSRSGLAVLFALTMVVATGTANAAVITYVGIDNGVGAGGARPNADAAAAAFQAAIGSGSLIDFEAAPLGNFANLVVAPGVMVTLVNNDGGFAGIRNNDFDNLGYNTTAGGDQHLRVSPFFNSPAGATAVFSFDNDIDAFGVYLTGAETAFPGPLTLTFNDGVVQVLNIPETNPSGVMFFGFTNFGSGFSSVALNGGATGSSRDIWGIDDATFRSVPEPGTLVLLTGGLLAGLARRRRS